MRRSPATREFLDRLTSFLMFALPQYVHEGKSYLTVAIGCTGGRHRSVMMAEALKKSLGARQGRHGASEAPGFMSRLLTQDLTSERCTTTEHRRRIERRSGIERNVSERVEKPWGYELHWAKTDRYVGKVLHVKAGHALSLQYHNRKDETIYLYSGRMLFEIERTASWQARDAAGRRRPRHAEDRAPDDGDRGLRHARGVHAGTATMW